MSACAADKGWATVMWRVVYHGAPTLRDIPAPYTLSNHENDAKHALPLLVFLDFVSALASPVDVMCPLVRGPEHQFVLDVSVCGGLSGPNKRNTTHRHSLLGQPPCAHLQRGSRSERPSHPQRERRGQRWEGVLFFIWGGGEGR